MLRVLIESPLKGDYEFNRQYAKRCMRDSLKRGEAPFASHLLYDQPGILDDRYQNERDRGMKAGFAWGAAAELVAVYVDLGISDGMRRGIEKAKELGLPIRRRRLSDNSDVEWVDPGYYRDVACPQCGRHRVEADGICEKCLWDIDGGDFASITRPTEYEIDGPVCSIPDDPFYFKKSDE